jgi:DNA-binding PadR family transcriptional regulator
MFGQHHFDDHEGHGHHDHGHHHDHGQAADPSPYADYPDFAGAGRVPGRGPGRGPRARAMRGGPGGPPFGGPWGGFDPRGGFPLGGPGFGRGRGRGGRGRRAGRGDIRSGILALLNEEPMHGYQIIQELSERSGGVWRPSPGSVYPTLSALEDEGLVRAEERDGKRVFFLTEAGQEAVAKRTSTSAPWDDVANDADGSLVALRDQMFQLGAAIMQVAQAGNRTQIEQAQKILTETRRKLYLLLAEDPDAGTGAATDDTEGPAEADDES